MQISIRKLCIWWLRGTFSNHLPLKLPGEPQCPIAHGPGAISCVTRCIPARKGLQAPITSGTLHRKNCDLDCICPRANPELLFQGRLWLCAGHPYTGGRDAENFVPLLNFHKRMYVILWLYLCIIYSFIHSFWVYWFVGCVGVAEILSVSRDRSCF